MIELYKIENTDYTRHGAAVLAPTECKVTEEAGGTYELSLVHPLDETGVWALVQPGDIIKAPVPAPDISTAVTGENVDIWVVGSSNVWLYSKPSAPVEINYGAWQKNHVYDLGAKVTGRGEKGGHQNFQLTSYLRGLEVLKEPKDLPSRWTKIANFTDGAPTLALLKSGEEFYLVNEYNTYWNYIQTQTGVTGYLQKSGTSYLRSEHRAIVPPRSVKEQLFRVQSISVDSSRRSLTVSARHVSYDLAGNLVGECEFINADPSVALARMKNALLFEHAHTLATNLTEEDGAYTTAYSWKNPISCLLDSDTGLVPFFGAKLLRDNWDIFIYRNDKPDRGVCLAYGVNLKGVTWKTNAGSFINRVIPVASRADGTALMLPELYVDSPIFDSYPVTKTEHLKVDGKIGGDDGSGGTWTEQTLLEHMRAAASERFTKDEADKANVELTVDFVMLGDTTEGAQYKGLQKLFIYDTVRVYDETIGLDLSPQVVRTEWDAINERYTKIGLGTVSRKLSRYVTGCDIVNGSIRFEKLSAEVIGQIKEAVT